MPGSRPLAVFVLSILALAVFQSSAYSQTVTATLGKSSQTSSAPFTVTLTPAATLQGFAANMGGTVDMEVWSIGDNGQKRKSYGSINAVIQTDANGNASVPAANVTKSLNFFKDDEGLDTTVTAEIIAAYNARLFKVYVTATVNGVTKTTEAPSPVIGGGTG